MIRKIFIGLGIFVMLLVIFFFWALQTVDYTPYFETNYYKTTNARFDSLTHTLTREIGQVHVGMSKKSITPILNADKDDPDTGKFTRMPLAGYGGREGAPASGIHDSLFVKAIAIKVQEEVIVLVGADMLIMPPEVSEKTIEKIEKIHGLTRRNVFFSATHTHSSVGAWSAGMVGELFGGAYNPLVIEWLSNQIADAIVSAKADLKVGQLGIGNFHAPDYVRNRLVGEDGSVNSDFMLMVASQLNGKKAILGSFDAHATTLGEWNMETSADYPGYWQSNLEQDGFDLAVFFAGSVGSHSYQSQGEKFDKSQYIGEALADSVKNHVHSIEMKDSISFTSLTLQVDIPEFQIRVSDGIRLNPFLAEKLFPAVGEVYLQAARIDGLIWATAPSDFSGETAIVYKNAMNKKGYRAMVSSFNGAYTGYIIPCKYYHLDAYESRLMNWFGPSYNPYINYMLGEMIETVSNDK